MHAGRAQSAGELLPGTIHAELPPAKLGAGRLIIIGDVHGCLAELRDLLEKLEYREGIDTVVLVGDMVDKGPHSLEVGPVASVPPSWSSLANPHALRRDVLHGVQQSEPSLGLVLRLQEAATLTSAKVQGKLWASLRPAHQTVGAHIARCLPRARAPRFDAACPFAQMGP